MPPTAGYSGTPLARKLGVKAGARLLVVHGPPTFAVPDLPAGVTVNGAATVNEDAEPYDVALLFATGRAELDRFAAIAGRLTVAGALWICWPKKAAVKAGLAVTELDETQVRNHGLAAGLVDTKIAAVDEVWSALRFVRRRADRPVAPRHRG